MKSKSYVCDDCGICKVDEDGCCAQCGKDAELKEVCSSCGPEAIKAGIHDHLPTELEPCHYIHGALNTEPCPDDFNTLDASQIRILHAAMGMCTESGEFIDAVKRNVFYGAELDYVNLIEEAGDILWYMAILLDECGYSFEEVMHINNLKLKKRFPHKFTQDHAIRRDIDAEREVLEKETHESANGTLAKKTPRVRPKGPTF